MHNLHFILINADSATKAAFEAEHSILDWGSENNWRSIGGIASEDGSDDVENHEDARWGLSFLDEEEGIPKEGTYFSRAVAYLHREIAQAIEFYAKPFSTHSELKSALLDLSDQLAAFDPDFGDTHDLSCVRHNLKHVSELIASRRQLKRGEAIPEFYGWQFAQFGLTDLTEHSQGARRYLVFLDMHS